MRETLELLEDLLGEKVINVLGREIDIPDDVTDREVVDHILKISSKSGDPTAQQAASVFNPVKWARDNGISRINSFTSDGIGLNAIRIIKNKKLMSILSDSGGKGLPIPKRGTYNWTQFTGDNSDFRDLVVGNSQEGPVSTQSLADPVGKGEIALSFLFGINKSSGDTDLVLEGRNFSVKYMGPRGDDSVNISEGSTKKVFRIASKILYPDVPSINAGESRPGSSVSDVTLELGQEGVEEARNKFLTFVSKKPEISLQDLKERFDGEYEGKDVEGAINMAIGAIELELFMTFDGGFRLGDHFDAKFSSISKGRIKIRQREGGEPRSETKPLKDGTPNPMRSVFTAAVEGYKKEAAQEESEKKTPTASEDEVAKSPYSAVRLPDPSTFTIDGPGIKALYASLGIINPPITESEGKTKVNDDYAQKIIDDVKAWADRIEKVVRVEKKDQPQSPIDISVKPIDRTQRISRSAAILLRNLETLIDYAEDVRADPSDTSKVSAFTQAKDDIIKNLESSLKRGASKTWRPMGRYTAPGGFEGSQATMFNELADISQDDIPESVARQFIDKHIKSMTPRNFKYFKEVVDELTRQQEERGQEPNLMKASEFLSGEFSTILDSFTNPATKRGQVDAERLYTLAVQSLSLPPSIQATGRTRPGPLVSETLALLEDLLTP